METHQIKQVQYEANQLLEIRELRKRINRNEPIKLRTLDALNDPLDDAVINLSYTNDNACYRAIADALETYEAELARKLSRVNEVSS